MLGRSRLELGGETPSTEESTSAEATEAATDTTSASAEMEAASPEETTPLWKRPLFWVVVAGLGYWGYKASAGGQAKSETE